MIIGVSVGAVGVIAKGVGRMRSVGVVCGGCIYRLSLRDRPRNLTWCAD